MGKIIMNVSELIERLQEMNPESSVLVISKDENPMSDYTVVADVLEIRGSNENLYDGAVIITN